MSRAAMFIAGTLAALAFAAAAGAAPVPQAGAFRATSCADCRQRNPAVAGSAAGFLVTWEGSTATDHRGAVARFFTGTGAPKAADFLVNKELPPDQYDADVAADPQGNYVVVWSAVADGNSEILAQRFKSTGETLGSAVKVNTDAAGSPSVPFDFSPAVATTKDGGFVVVWMSLLPNSGTFAGTPPGIYARRFSNAGVPLSAQVKISTGLVGGDRPDVCVDTSGRPVAVWTSVDGFRPFEPNKKGVSARRLSAAGVPQGREIVVARPLAPSAEAAVSCGKGNTFVVVWHTDQAPAAAQNDILGLRFTRTGRPAGTPFRVNSNSAGEQKAPAISHDATGAFVIVWQSGSGQQGIYGRRFLASAAADGADFEVLRETVDPTQRSQPSIAHLTPAGNFVVVWQNGNLGTYGRRFSLSRRRR
ncbi:MAG TPA: hypothetical protein VLQ45_10350 [Thermoanaerobaculia bacterium]|nr:hypothetical protein [Thermoanaerobaculia bacterium]